MSPRQPVAWSITSVLCCQTTASRAVWSSPVQLSLVQAAGQAHWQILPTLPYHQHPTFAAHTTPIDRSP